MKLVYTKEYVHRQILQPFCYCYLDFSNFVLVFCLVHDRVYIHDGILVYASLD